MKFTCFLAIFKGTSETTPMPPSTNEASPLKNIILVGFMGCGKSTIGRVISQQLNYPLIDTDYYIEEQTNHKISDIFKQHGEPYFRDIETDLVSQLLDNRISRQIISTGGGLPKRESNRETLKSLGYVVWLKASVESIHQRTSMSNHRPLLQSKDPKVLINKMIEEKTPIYEDCAHLTVQTDDLSINDTVHGVIESARYFFSNH